MLYPLSPQLLIFLLVAAAPSAVLSSAPLSFVLRSSNDRHEREVISTKMLLNPVVANLVAGSVAGAIGCGLAHPLDTLKTKAQMSTTNAQTKAVGPQIAEYKSYRSMTQRGLLGMEAALPLTVEDLFQSTFDLSFPVTKTAPPKPNMLQVAHTLYQQEGLQGFYGGVQTMMLGQALIRAVCFTTNAAVIDHFQGSSLDSFTVLMLAAFSAGVTSSFVATPVERIKVMMQSNQGVYSDEMECIQAVLDKEGLGGLMSRGLCITLAREIPSVGLSFVLYAALMQMGALLSLGSMAPLLFGAISGSACCVPVYPFDCVKTRVQNTEGDETRSPLEIAQNLYDNRGVDGFVDGLTPKMLRCAVLYAVSFSVYDAIKGMFYAMA